MDYDGSDTAKDQVKRIAITLNEKLAILKVWHEQISAAIEKSFSSAIRRNASLTNVDKFNYLRSLLDGPALNSITGLPLMELSSKEDIEILTE